MSSVCGSPIRSSRSRMRAGARTVAGVTAAAGATRAGAGFGATVSSPKGEISALVCAGAAAGNCVMAAIGGETDDSGFAFATGGVVICDAVSLAGLFSAKTTAGVAAAIVTFGPPVETGAFVEAVSATVTFGLAPAAGLDSTLASAVSGAGLPVDPGVCSQPRS